MGRDSEPIQGLRQRLQDVWRVSVYLMPDTALKIGSQILHSEAVRGKEGGDPWLKEGALALLRQSCVMNPLHDQAALLCETAQAFIEHSHRFKRWARVRWATEASHAPLGRNLRRDTESVQTDVESPSRGGTLCDQDPTDPGDTLFRLWREGKWSPTRRWSEWLLETPSGKFMNALCAWAAWAAGDVEATNDWLNMPVPETFLTLNLKAEMALKDGDKGKALEYFIQSLEWEPWQPHVIYRIWECLQPVSSLPADRSARVRIAIYTYNKFDVTLKTLVSVLESRTYGAPIFLLNNGSTAFEPQEFERAVREIAGDYPVRILHLPVNIGAPAARNWLWHHPEMKKAEMVAFLDDDVLVPPHWLEYYIQDLNDFPNAVVVGPRVVNHDDLRTIQYVHRYFSDYGDHIIRFTPSAPIFADLGQYSYRHPCLSVMGCCHLFHRGRWEAFAIPDFDIRFSPSQVDDLEHDLGIWLRGGEVIFDGRVGVVHCQDAGRAGISSEAEWGHVWGNHMKMEAKYDLVDLDKIYRRVLTAERAHERQVRRNIKSLGIELPMGVPGSFFAT